MPKLDLAQIEFQTGSSYPEPYASEMGDRGRYPLGEAGGLTQFGANLMVLQPGSKSSLRHWHKTEDEFVMVTQGELVLVQDEGEILMRRGSFAAFKAGDTNGHHLINRSDREARFLVIGTKVKSDVCTYSDVDLRVEIDGPTDRFTRKDGSDL
ncbi:MAG: cupin domain-containing protein [Alphaproteobacteria bacterium]|nr:cupin domain-containing protein [Alphaproteobacteria bacterium]